MGSLRQREDGQAMVEAAIALPLWLVLFLCTLQLALLARARVLVEYAGYQAARAGIVWNADPQKMQRAAHFVLAPTACPTGDPAARHLCKVGEAVEGGPIWQRQAAGLLAMEALSSDHALGFPGAHVHILNPHWPSHRHLFDVGPGEELNFDRPRTEEARDATLLSIQVQYWFELKIPLADWVIWSAWVAARGGLDLAGSLLHPGLAEDDPSLLEAYDVEGRIQARARTAALPAGDELNRGGTLQVSERAWRAMIDAGSRGGSKRQRSFYLPVTAHHTMRMQSNVFARFIRDCSCERGQGCGETCRAW